MSIEIDSGVEPKTFEERIAALAVAPSDAFTDLVTAANLNPRSDLRFGDFAECGFDEQKLQGYDFTGCNLTKATFANATLGNAIFDAARVDLAALRSAKDFNAWFDHELSRANRHKLNPQKLRDFARFRESPFAPEMIVLPAGSFRMGSDLDDTKLPDSDNNKAWEDEAVPGVGKRDMRIARRFAIGKYPVTFDEYAVFCEAKKRKLRDDKKWGRGNRPVLNVSWDDAMAYVGWLNETLGITSYRLPSEAEWEYACRAGKDTRRWWGDDWDPERANGARSFEKGRTSPVDHYPANPWGLHDMIGNVWEWCADRFNENIGELPDGGVAFDPVDKSKENFPHRVLRGGSWDDDPGALRCAFRDRVQPDDRGDIVGFRLARTL